VRRVATIGRSTNSSEVRRGLNGSFLADLNQTPPYGSCGLVVPCSTPGSIALPWHKGLLSSLDHLTVTGEAMWEEDCSQEGLSPLRAHFLNAAAAA